MSRAGALKGTCLGVAVAGAAATLVACGSVAPAELVDVRWQLTRIEDARRESGTAVESGVADRPDAVVDRPGRRRVIHWRHGAWR